MMSDRVPLKISSPRLAVLIALGFASGLPNTLSQDTLKAWLSATGVDVTQIGLFSLIVWPYVFKFLWAPLMDRFTPPWLGRRRGWLALTQAGLVLALAAIAFTGPSHPDSRLLPLAVAGTLLVFLSASQDIVADAYRTDVLEPAELGLGAAVFVTGYRVAMIVASAGALFLAARFEWRVTYLIMACLMACGIIVSRLAPEPARGEAPVTLRASVFDPLKEFFTRHGGRALFIFLFIFLFKLPDVLANNMTMPLLLKELKYSLDQVGVIRQFVGFFLVIVGAFVGGALVPRLGLIRSLWIFGILQAVSNAGFWLLSVIGNQPEAIHTFAWSFGSWAGDATLTRGLAWLIGAIMVENFCAGLVTAGFVAFLMSQCDARYSAFQYAILSAIMAASGLCFGPYAGFLVDKLGYAQFFLLTIIAAAPGLACLPFFRETENK